MTFILTSNLRLIRPTNSSISMSMISTSPSVMAVAVGMLKWPSCRKSSSFRFVRPNCCRARALNSPAELADFTLLHENRKQWWEEWLRSSGVTNTMDWRGTTFQNHLAIEAAEAGQGFALGDQILCTDSLVEGWLLGHSLST